MAFQELARWDQPPVHSGWRLFEPVVLVDWRVHSQNKKGIERLYQLGPSIDEIPEEEIDAIIELLSGVVSTIDGYLKVRGTETLLLRRIRAQRQMVSSAIESLKRGYAPGSMPSDQERLDLGSKRLREIGLTR